MSNWTATQYSKALDIDLWKFQHYVSLGFIESVGLNKRYNKLYDSSYKDTLKEKIQEYENISTNFISKSSVLKILNITEKRFDELVSKNFIHTDASSSSKNVMNAKNATYNRILFLIPQRK